MDVLECPTCKGRMKLIALVTDSKSVARYLAKIGELTDVPDRSPSRGPPYWKTDAGEPRSCAWRAFPQGSPAFGVSAIARYGTLRPGMVARAGNGVETRRGSASPRWSGS